MQFRVDPGELWYGVKISVLIGAVFFIGARSVHEIVRYSEPASDEMVPVSELPPFVAFARGGGGEKTLAYAALDNGALILPSHEAVAARRDALIAAREDFIFADLSANKLSLYKSGVLVKTFVILGYGKEGTFFETPSGVYRVQSKEENHFSTIGHVWMPWSMHFFGNYFIHGWPTYPDGRAVPPGYSGGCIRLSTADAKELFSLSTGGIAVLTASEENTMSAAHNAQAQYFRRVAGGAQAAGQEPKLSAPSVLAVDFTTGQILFERDKDTARPIASLTKLMTALVAIETINRFKIITMSASAHAMPGDSAGLAVGESFQSQDYLYPLLLESSNDVAALYAEQVGGFVGIMNQKARGIGMERTHYADVSGLDPENTSSAVDIFRLLQFLNNHKKPIFDILGIRDYTRTSHNGGGVHQWHNVNWSSDDARFVAGKAGFIGAADYVMAGVWRMKFAEEGEQTVAIIILGSHDQMSDTNVLIDYLEKNFVYGTVLTHKDDLAAPAGTLRTGAVLYEAIPALNIR
ncbi:MAG: L,D-transpeptidase family protein [bacterium]|nr:L,D-transpeptidase family protein [bacterium]MDZ4299688.1 L,D-transpeptidase family protein [Candidatus Sungbacteria bacterium]